MAKSAMDRLAKKQEKLDDLLSKQKETEKRIQQVRKEMSAINNARNKKWTDALQAALNKNGGSIDLSRIPVEDVLAWLQSRSNKKLLWKNPREGRPRKFLPRRILRPLRRRMLTNPKIQCNSF